jgi:hypothetical protein
MSHPSFPLLGVALLFCSPAALLRRQRQSCEEATRV